MATLILNRPVIGVTGSAGKTTTKEMIAAILATHWKVFKNPSNNNIIPSTRRHAQRINSSHQAVVLEFGMAAPGLIRMHCRIIQPNIGVITNVGSAHIGNFGGKIERLAAAKSELIKYMKSSGFLVINADDIGSKALITRGFKGKLVTVGIENDATYRARRVKFAHGGMTFEALVGGRWYEVFIPVPGIHNVYNALMAIAVADHLGFTPPEILSGFRKMYRTGRRVYVHHLGNGITLIDDSYSANPHAVKAAIDVLMNVGGGKRIMVLGEMRELGVYTGKGHREVGNYIARSGVDYFLALGPKTRYAVQEAVRSGMSLDRVKYFNSRLALHNSLKELLNGQATVLIKGSHGSEMHLTADYLRGKKRRKTNRGTRAIPRNEAASKSNRPPRKPRPPASTAAHQAPRKNNNAAARGRAPRKNQRSARRENPV